LGKLIGATLYFSYNKLTGGIPASYANLNLLAVDYNQLSDLHQIGSPVPHNTSQIFLMSAVGNKLAGPLPNWIASFETLQMLDMSHNKLTGMVLL
jgi:Leucine-rich repeat (LRR) protein